MRKHLSRRVNDSIVWATNPPRLGRRMQMQRTAHQGGCFFFENEVGMKFTKPPLSIPGQVEKLKGRGLVIGDNARAASEVDPKSWTGRIVNLQSG